MKVSSKAVVKNRSSSISCPCVNGPERKFLQTIVLHFQLFESFDSFWRTWSANKKTKNEETLSLVYPVDTLLLLLSLKQRPETAVYYVLLRLEFQGCGRFILSSIRVLSGPCASMHCFTVVMTPDKRRSRAARCGSVRTG